MVRADLPPGLQIAQSAHALTEFILKHNDIATRWNKESNYIAILSVKDEQELRDIIRKASSRDIRFAIFHEPDRNNEMTAAALEPGIESKRVCSNLSLALKG